MTSQRKTYFFFIVLFIIWLWLSSGRLLLYSYEAVVDAKEWLPLSEEQRSIKAYGSLFLTAKTIASVIPSRSYVLLATNDGWTFFLLRYLLYPREVSWSKDQRSKEIRFTYMIRNQSKNTQKFSIWKKNGKQLIELKVSTQ